MTKEELEQARDMVSVKFTETKEKRDQTNSDASALSEEMNRLQGEYRTYERLIATLTATEGNTKETTKNGK